MLSKSILTKSINVAESLSRNKKQLLPFPNSHVTSMIEATSMESLFATMEDHQIKANPLTNASSEAIVAAVAESTNHAEEGQLPAHSIAMNGPVAETVAQLKKVIKLAKFHYYPMVQALEDIVSKEIERQCKLVTNYDIEIVKVNPLLLDSSIHSMVSTYKNSKPMVLAADSLLELESSKIKELAFTGNPGFNDELDQIGDDGWNRISMLYNGNIELSSLTDIECIAAFLASKAIVNNLTGLKLNTTPDVCTSKLSRIIEQAGVRVYNTISRNYDAAKSNNIYMGKTYVKDGINVIPVRDDVYKRLLNEGLTPEAVIGNEAPTYESNHVGRRFAGTNLIENKDKLCKNYDICKEIEEANLRKRLNTVGKNILIRTLSDYIKREDEANLAYSKEILQTKLKEFQKVNFDYENIYESIKCVLLGTFFDWCDLKRFVDIVDDLAKHAEDHVSKREITLTATIIYVCNWIGKGQMACVSK